MLGMGPFSASNDTQLGLTFTYMATDNIGVELLAATPFRHKVGLGPTGTTATVRQLPPTLMAQYYFLTARVRCVPMWASALTTPPSMMPILTRPDGMRA